MCIRDRIKAWDELFSLKGSCGDEVSQCAVSGEKLPVARIHDKIKGIPGGQVCGCVFVGVNNDSESSYGKKQSYNSNISVKVMKKYTCALNYLCSEVSHKTFVDNITFVYWAQRANENKYHSLFNSLFLSDEQSPDADAVIDGFRKKLCGDLIPEKAMDVLKSVDVDTNFYIVGLKPNSSRLSLKFCFCKSFGDILENGALHQYDMSLSSMPKRIPLWRIIRCV